MRRTLLVHPTGRRVRIDELGCQQGLLVDLPAHVDTCQIGFGALRLVIDSRNSDLDGIFGKAN